MYTRKATGDKTGMLLALQNTRIYVETESVRTQAPVNYQVNTGGQIVLPVRTTLRGTRTSALTVNGEIHGIEELRLSSNVATLVTEKGQSACLECNTTYTTPTIAHYWFKKLKISLGATFEVQSSSKDISTQSVYIHVLEAALDYTGSIKADAVNVLANYFSIEFDATTDASYSGWPSQQGSGSLATCSGVFGAGHGGAGGYGYWTGCGSCPSSVTSGTKICLFWTLKVPVASSKRREKKCRLNRGHKTFGSKSLEKE